MTEHEAHEIEEWVYGGSRVGKDHKRIVAWVGPDNDEQCFKAGGSYIVGSVYRVKVIRKDDRVSMIGTPKYSGERSSDKELLNSLSAQHRAAELTLSVKARERADKRDDPLEQLLKQLEELAAYVPATQRAAFAGYVTHRIMRARKTS